MNQGNMKDTPHAGDMPGEAFQAAGCLLHCICARAGPGLLYPFWVAQATHHPARNELSGVTFARPARMRQELCSAQS